MPPVLAGGQPRPAATRPAPTPRRARAREPRTGRRRLDALNAAASGPDRPMAAGVAAAGAGGPGLGRPAAVPDVAVGRRRRAGGDGGPRDPPVSRGDRVG